MVNKKRLINLTQQLIRIDSQNPPGNESRIAHFVQDYLLKAGLKSQLFEFKKGRSNVVAALGGKKKKQDLLITPHLDTVPAGNKWHFHPFLGEIHKNRVYGLGATDCKGNLACCLEAINSLLEERVILDYNLVFAATADEECGSGLGLIPLLDKGRLKPQAALVLDSDDFDIIVTQKGLIHLKVKIRGKRAHGAYPWWGINAIEIAADILKELKAQRFRCKKNKYLKAPTLNFGTIKGGDKVNIVADSCEFELDFRFLPGMSEKKILNQIKRVISKYAKEFKLEIENIQKPYSIEPSHYLVKSLSAAMKKMQVEPKIKGSEGATTITFFQNKDIPAIATGFGSRGCAHVADEYVKIDSLYKGALILEEFLRSYRNGRD